MSICPRVFAFPNKTTGCVKYVVLDPNVGRTCIVSVSLYKYPILLFQSSPCSKFTSAVPNFAYFGNSSGITASGANFNTLSLI